MYDRDQHFAVFLGLVVTLRVVDGDGEISGQFLAHSVLEDVLHLAL